MTASNSKATQSPAMCLSVEEIGRVFGEVFAYVIFQRKVALSFTETHAKMDDRRAPFEGRQLSCLTLFIDEATNLNSKDCRLVIFAVPVWNLARL